MLSNDRKKKQEEKDLNIQWKLEPSKEVRKTKRIMYTEQNFMRISKL